MDSCKRDTIEAIVVTSGSSKEGIKLWKTRIGFGVVYLRIRPSSSHLLMALISNRKYRGDVMIVKNSM